MLYERAARRAARVERYENSTRRTWAILTPLGTAIRLGRSRGTKTEHPRAGRRGRELPGAGSPSAATTTPLDVPRRAIRETETGSVRSRAWASRLRARSLRRRLAPQLELDLAQR
jgi:hypothetical protein